MTYYVSYFSTDYVGNVETSSINVPVMIDKIAPATTDDAPADWVNVDTTVSFSPTDADSGLVGGAGPPVVGKGPIVE